MDGLGKILGPLINEIPPKLGSRKPADLARQALLLRRLTDVDQRKAVDLTRLLTEQRRRPHRGHASSPTRCAACSRCPAVIGTWAGPRTPGTAYVIAHHHIGDLGDGRIGAWGFPRGGMGGVTQALAAAARSFGAEIRTEAPVARITTKARRGHRRHARGRHRDQRADRHHHDAPADLVPAPASTAPTCPPTSSTTSSATSRAAAR